MQFIAVCIALFAAFTTARAAFQHNSTAQDGVYSHYVDDNGVSQTIYLGPTKPSTRRRRSLAARDSQGQGVQCQADVSMSTADASSAANALADIFGAEMIFFKAISAKSGSAVAYGCDYGKGQGMNHDQFLAYMADIATECGSTAAGFFRDVGSKSAYGRTNAGVGFC